MSDDEGYELPTCEVCGEGIAGAHSVDGKRACWNCWCMETAGDGPDEDEPKQCGVCGENVPCPYDVVGVRACWNCWRKHNPGDGPEAKEEEWTPPDGVTTEHDVANKTVSWTRNSEPAAPEAKMHEDGDKKVEQFLAIMELPDLPGELRTKMQVVMDIVQRRPTLEEKKDMTARIKELTAALENMAEAVESFMNGPEKINVFDMGPIIFRRKPDGTIQRIGTIGGEDATETAS